LNWTGRLSTGLFLIEIVMNFGMGGMQQPPSRTTTATENNKHNRKQQPQQRTNTMPDNNRNKKVHIYNAVFLTGYLFYMTGV